MIEKFEMPPIPIEARRMAVVATFEAYRECSSYLSKDGLYELRRKLRDPGERDYDSKIGLAEHRAAALHQVCRRLVELGEPEWYFADVRDLMPDAPDDAAELEES